MRRLVAALFIAGAAADAQTIELRKIRTLVDRNGRGFTRAPIMAVDLGRGRYALQEINELPMVVDTAGRIVKFFARGEGPGELLFNATSLAAGAGDTLYAGNQGSFSVFGPDLKFVRSIPLRDVSAGSVVPLRGRLVLSSQKVEGPHMTSLHVVTPNGDIVRSFARDTFDRKIWPPPAYRIAEGSGNTVLAGEVYTHRVERWTLDGRRLLRIDTRPAWFDTRRPAQDGRPYLRGVAEADGVIWVFSSVPVADYRRIMADALRGRGDDVDARFIPDEKLSTTRLEAYDAATGKLLADLAIRQHGIALLGPRQIMLYSTGRNDEAQLEVWEIRLKR